MNEKTAAAIWKKTNELLQGEGFGARDLILKSNVKVICTTDDPADALTYHAAISQDAEDRTARSAFRQIGSLGPLLITSVIVIPILVHFDNVHIGYPAVMGMMAAIGIAGFMFCCRNCKERIIVREAPKEKLSVMSVLKCFIGNKPLLTVVFMTIFSISAYNIKSAMLVYFVQYNLNNAELMSYMSFIIIGSSFLGVLFMPNPSNASEKSKR